MICYHSSMHTKTELERSTMSRTPGRKMSSGKLVFNPATNQFGVFLGYCSSCDEKSILNKTELPRMIGTYHKTNRTIKVRLLRYIQKQLEASQ